MIIRSWQWLQTFLKDGFSVSYKGIYCPMSIKKAAPVLPEAAFVDRRIELSNLFHRGLAALGGYLI
jgi:hypothetical protein